MEKELEKESIDDFRKGVRACFDFLQTIACNTDNEEKADFLYDLSDDLLQNVSINDYNNWKNLKEAMKPKTCKGCKWELETNLIRTKVGDKVDICTLCTRYENLQDNYEKKDNA